MPNEQLTESFMRDRSNVYSILHSDYEGMTHSEARQKIVSEKLQNRYFAFSLSKLRRQSLLDIGYSSGNLTSQCMNDGIIWARCHHDGTEDTGKITFGEKIVFDTLSGKAVTGINEEWGTSEYKVIGIALGNFDYDAEGTPYGKIPIKLETVSELIDGIPFLSDYKDEEGEEADINPFTISGRVIPRIGTPAWIWQRGFGCHSSPNQLINGPSIVPYGSVGYGFNGVRKPAKCIARKTSLGVGSNSGFFGYPICFGTVPGEDKLYMFLDGWYINFYPGESPAFQVEDEPDLCYVTAYRKTNTISQNGYATFKSNWQDSQELLNAYASGPSGYREYSDSSGVGLVDVYDGSSDEFPLYEIRVDFPDIAAWNVNPTAESVHNSRFIDPVFREGDSVPLSRFNKAGVPTGDDFQFPLMPDMPYIDAPVGTIIMKVFYAFTNPSESRYRHWALCDGTENSTGNGGSGLDLREKMIVGWDDRESPPSFSDTYGSGDGAFGGELWNKHSLVSGGWLKSGVGDYVFNSDSDGDHLNLPYPFRAYFFERIP